MRQTLFGAVALIAMAGSAMADDLIGDWRTAPDDNGNTGIHSRWKQCGQSPPARLGAGFRFRRVPTCRSENIGRRIIAGTITTPTGGGGPV